MGHISRLRGSEKWAITKPVAGRWGAGPFWGVNGPGTETMVLTADWMYDMSRGERRPSALC